MNELKSYEEFNESVNSHNWLLVYVSANWCKPCSGFSPIVEKISNIYSKLLGTVKIDVEKVPEVAGEYDLKSVPTLLLFHKGRVVEGVVGVQSSGQITQWLSQKVLVH